MWVPVADETAVVTALLTAGWASTAGARYRVESGPGVRLTVSPLALADVPALADAVAAAVRPVAGGRSV